MKHNITSPFGFLLTNRSFLALSLLAIISLSIDAEDSLAAFDPMDVFDLEWASDPRVSPDGRPLFMSADQTIL
jgi:hypothetical protein